MAGISLLAYSSRRKTTTHYLLTSKPPWLLNVIMWSATIVRYYRDREGHLYYYEGIITSCRCYYFSVCYIAVSIAAGSATRLRGIDSTRKKKMGRGIIYVYLCLYSFSCSPAQQEEQSMSTISPFMVSAETGRGKQKL